MKKGFGLALLAGVVIGAAAGILLAPDKGSETRKKIKGSIDDAKDKFRSGIATAKQKFEDLKIQGEDGLFEDIENAGEEMIASLEQKLADLKSEVAKMKNKKEA